MGFLLFGGGGGGADYSEAISNLSAQQQELSSALNTFGYALGRTQKDVEQYNQLLETKDKIFSKVLNGGFAAMSNAVGATGNYLGEINARKQKKLDNIEAERQKIEAERKRERAKAEYLYMLRMRYGSYQPSTRRTIESKELLALNEQRRYGR
ncbi:MAG: hypothetical protein AB7U45_03700 [Desulfamplus sp.]